MNGLEKVRVGHGLKGNKFEFERHKNSCLFIPIFLQQHKPFSGRSMRLKTSMIIRFGIHSLLGSVLAIQSGSE